jgi:hypothetical protein
MSMADAFNKSWDLAKVDFRFDKDRNLGWSSTINDSYRHRIPIRQNEDGKMIYQAGRSDPITDRSWVNLAAFGPNDSDDLERRIIETIMHESMHDADTDVGTPARRFDDSKGRPRFGNRNNYSPHRMSLGLGEPANVIRRKDGGRRINPHISVSGRIKFEGAKDELTFNPPADVGSALTRDDNLAAETMAYIGEHPRARGTANLETMKHSNVSPIDTKWLADKINWNSSLRSSKPKRMKRMLRNYFDLPSIPSDGSERPNIEGFETSKTEQVRRNLVNALNDTAMTRMTQSGEFLENPKTSQISGYTEGSRTAGKIRPMKPQIDAAKKETSKARRAINRHWKKIEAGEAPLPNSIEDLPQDIQELIGQQQIRAKLGLMRGLESDAVNLGNPMDVLNRKYEDMFYLDDGELPRDEQLNILREYLKEILADYKLVEPSYDRWGNVKDRDGYYIGDTRLGTEAFAGREVDKRTGENADFQGLGNLFGDRDTRWEHYFPELKEEFPELYESRTPYVVPKRNKPGNVYEIKPALENVKNESKNFPLNRKPPSIPLKDWIEMYNYNLRENERRERND